jgi:hypothetical protein
MGCCAHKDKPDFILDHKQAQDLWDKQGKVEEFISSSEEASEKLSLMESSHHQSVGMVEDTKPESA